jgi:hypothetical protein
MELGCQIFKNGKDVSNVKFSKISGKKASLRFVLADEFTLTTCAPRLSPTPHHTPYRVCAGWKIVPRFPTYPMGITQLLCVTPIALRRKRTAPLQLGD